MFIVFLVLGLIALGGSTEGMSTNATLYALMSVIHNLTGSIIGWVAILAVLGVVATAISALRNSADAATCSFGCLILLPIGILVGTALAWVLTGGMLNTFSPETGPTSVLFWLWLVLAFTFGQS